MKKLTAIFVTSLALVGCGQKGEDGLLHYYSDTQAPFVERPTSDRITDLDVEAMLSKVDREDFALRLVRFSDRRPPANRMVKRDDDTVIYEYLPDQLLGDVSVRIPHQIKVDWPQPTPDRDIVYPVEVDLKHMKTIIKTGGFVSGRFGRYAVEMEADYVIRDADSNVLERDTVVFEANYKRKTVDGRRPSASEDRQAMVSAVRRAVRRLSAEIAWEARHLDTGEKFLPGDY